MDVRGKKRLALIVGTRPNFVKIAPILKALESYPLDPVLIHTGQHYDSQLSSVFFEQLQIREPDVNLHVGSGTHAQQTAEIMTRFEEFLNQEKEAGRPFSMVLVVGDVNSTLACGLVAAKLSIPLVHVEAGLRSFDRSMPEEINRLATDSISDWLYCSEVSGVENLRREGHDSAKVKLMGNVMIDTLRRFQPIAAQRPILDDLNLKKDAYGVVTLHRPANVDSPVVLSNLLKVLNRVSKTLPLVFAVHPRTQTRIRDLGFEANEAGGTFRLIGPQSYLDFLALTSQSKFVITDSGGLQEETTAMEVPCLTMRSNTERPVTVSEGSSRLIGQDIALLDRSISEILTGKWKNNACPALWDGQASQRIAEHLFQTLCAGEYQRAAA